MMSRLSILGMMVFVGIVALETALTRTFWASHMPIVVGVVPTAVLLQLAAWQAYRGKRGRAFVLGALVGGLLAMASFVYANLTPEVLGISPMSSGSTLIRKPGSRTYDAWQAYTEPTFGLIVRSWPSLRDPGGQVDEDWTPGWRLLGVRSLVYSLPQWLTAFFGGLMFWGFATIRRRRFAEA